TEQRHQRRMTGEDSDLTVVRRGHDSIRLALEQHGLRGDHRYLEHTLRVRELLRGLDYSVDAALHEERLLRILIEFAGDKPLERGDRLLELHILSLDTSELLGDGERLRHETLNPARSSHDKLVLFGELVHAENRDDVLQLLIPLQNALHIGRYLIVAISDELRVENSGRGSKRIDGGINTELGDRARQYHCRVEVSERSRGRRIGNVVGG